MLSETQLVRLYIGFTPRQRQIAHLVSEGLSNQQIANLLYIAPSVVAGHLTNIYGEIGVLETFSQQSPNRYTVIRLFSGFLKRHPECNPFQEDDSAGAVQA